MAQISMEAALDACKIRLGELVYEVVLLRAQNSGLEAELGRKNQRLAELEAPLRDTDPPAAQPGAAAGVPGY